MKTYVGIDLHSNNCYFASINELGKRVFHRRVANNETAVLEVIGEIEKHGDIISLVVESTYNWYWLVDILEEHGYKIKLANPSKINQYSGLKVTTDKSDAFFLAELLRLDVIPGCWIFPKELRPIRDLLRTRSFFVTKRTSFKNSLTSLIARQTGIQMSYDKVISLGRAGVDELVGNSIITSRIRHLCSMIHNLSASIGQIEKEVLKDYKLKNEFKGLLSVPGIGVILALTIMAETGDIRRFAKSGNYTSYCRCVESKRTSNEKKKGTNNKKNGNPYLAWAYSEAAVYSKRYCPPANKYWQRKSAKGGTVLAYKSLAAKLTKACYYIMRDNTKFSKKKLFGYEDETLEALPTQTL